MLRELDSAHPRVFAICPLPQTTKPRSSQTAYILPDVLKHGLKVVFCGSAVGRVSALKQAYYAGPGNKFWCTLYEVGLTPKLITPQEYASITQWGIGLTDIVKTIAGADAILRKPHFDRTSLEQKLLTYQPHILAFTCKRAAHEFFARPVDYGLQTAQLGSTHFFVLPSPSGLARRFWSIQPWQALVKHITSQTQ